MAITIDLPPGIEAQLRSGLDNIDDVAKLGLAVEAYRSAKLSLGQFADLLGISQYEADGLLKERGVFMELSSIELAQERHSIDRLLGP